MRLASEVASALDYAHRQGIVHRDIKPANILLHDDSALVADFGIALAVRNAGADRITETGLSLGTPHYMSPEQATGDRDPDARSDVYSLAAVLYEMLAGEPPHTGSTVQAVIAKVLTEPVKPVRDARQSVPVHVALAVEQALAKIPADRFDSAADFAEALHDPAVMMSGAGAGAPVSKRGSRRGMLVAGIVGGLALGIGIGRLLDRSASALSASRVVFEIPPDSGATLCCPAMSPDGTAIVYVATSSSGSRLMVRRVDEGDARPLPGTEGGYDPFFSPDGAWVAFPTQDELKKIRLDGGTPILVTPTPFVASGVWTNEDTLVLSLYPHGLVRVAADGGVPEPIPQQDTTLWLFLQSLTADERAVIATDAGARSGRTLALDLTTGATRELGPFGGAALVWPDALAYFTVAGHLIWQRFDDETATLTGPAVRLGGNVSVGLTPGGWNNLTGSRNGGLAYVSGTEGGQDLVLLDRRGSGTVLLHQAGLREPRFSPDGRLLTYSANVTGHADARSLDSRSVGREPVDGSTEERRNNLGGGAHWSPDGRRIVFRAKTDGVEEDDLFIQDVDGVQPRDPILRRPGIQAASDWSRDGRTIVFLDVSATGYSDIWSVSASGGEATPFFETRFEEAGPRISPDGRWIAYCSNETGALEVYVESFPIRGHRVLISVGGGCDPAWRGDGGELYYWHGDELVAVSLSTSAEGPPSATKRETVLSRRYVSGAGHGNYDVSPDGRHFAIVSDGTRSGKLVVMLNAVRRERQ